MHRLVYRTQDTVAYTSTPHIIAQNALVHKYKYMID